LTLPLPHPMFSGAVRSPGQFREADRSDGCEQAADRPYGSAGLRRSGPRGRVAGQALRYYRTTGTFDTDTFVT
jgi:hypothetical protein